MIAGIDLNSSAMTFLERFSSEIADTADQLELLEGALLSDEDARISPLDLRAQKLDELTQRLRALSQVAQRLAEHATHWKAPVSALTEEITLADLAARLSGRGGRDRPSEGDCELF